MPVLVRLDPQQKSTGIIQETANLMPGVLEIPPFAPGTANSFFDIYSEIVIGPSGANQQVLHTAEPIHMESTITHKPPRPGERYQERRSCYRSCSRRDPSAERRWQTVGLHDLGGDSHPQTTD